MPIYGYLCKSCEHAFDALQKMDEPRLLDCPECGEASLQKQLSAPKFRLKGKGWYETDFKTGEKKNLAGDSASSDKPKEGKAKDGDSKATKPEKKSDSKKASTSDSKAKSA